VTNALALTALDGTYPIAGIEYGYWVDITASFCNLTNVMENFGLATPSLNVYNGVEPATGSVTCAAPLNSLSTCGNEPASAGSGVRPFGDFITNVTQGNALWLQLTAPGALPLARAYWFIAI
jgi:hypothetical protein